MKRHKIQLLTLLTGSLLALSIVLSQVLQPQLASSLQADTQTEQGESDRASDESLISLPSFSLPAPVCLQQSLDSYCLFEILFEDPDKDIVSEGSAGLPKKLLTTLFRVIISPNAP